MIKKSMYILIIIAFLQNTHMIALNDYYSMPTSEAIKTINAEIAAIDRKLGITNSSQSVVLPLIAVLASCGLIGWSALTEVKKELLYAALALFGLAGAYAVGDSYFSYQNNKDEKNVLNARRDRLLQQLVDLHR